MTDLWIWGLLASLIVLAIGTTLKSAYDAFLLKNSDKEITRLLSEIESLKTLHKEAVSGIEQSNAAAVAKLTERVKELEQQLSLINLKPIKYPSRGASWMG